MKLNYIFTLKEAASIYENLYLNAPGLNKTEKREILNNFLSNPAQILSFIEDLEHDIKLDQDPSLIPEYTQLSKEVVRKLHRHIKTLKLNSLLQIKKLDMDTRFYFTKYTQVSYQGYTLFIEGLGYLAFKSDGEPYIPSGGKKSLQSIMQMGGFIHFDDLYFIKPINDTTRFEIPEYEAQNIIYTLLKRTGHEQIKIENIHWLNTETFNTTVSYTWFLNGHTKQTDHTEKTFYLNNKKQWKYF